LSPDLQPLFDVILNHIPAPNVDADAPLQMLVTTLGYDDYRGVTAVGRIFAGTIKAGQALGAINAWMAKFVRIGALSLHIHEGFE
jgi:GTP-binding protein